MKHSARTLWAVPAALLLLSPTAAWAAAKLGAVVRVAGEVTFVRGTPGEAQPAPLQVGASVEQGDLIRTGADSRVQLLLDDRSVVNVGPKAELRLAGLDTSKARRKLSLTLMAGRMWARVSHLLGNDSDFEVESQNAVAGVRGTSFFMETAADGTSTETTVENGNVELTDRLGQKVFLGPMRRGLTRVGSGTTLTEVTPQLIASMQSDVNAPTWSDPGRMQGVWEQVKAASDAAGDAAAAQQQRDQMQKDLLGAGNSQLPSTPLNLEPGQPVIVRGRVVPMPVP